MAAHIREANLGSYELLDHTADLMIVGRGASQGEALAWVATGMFSVIADLDSVQTRDTVRLTVASTDRETLVVDWLNELLFRYETEAFLAKEFDVTVDKAGTALEARCLGERADPDRHQTWPGIKAATYHALNVAHNGEWRIQVVLDI